jgi:ERCC4-type nuclease
MKTDSTPTFVIDSREQKPYTFAGPSIVATLATGDYSIQGLETMVGVERKELSDMINCITTSRGRFERELERAGTFKRFWVLIESDIAAIERHQYRSAVNPEAVLGSLAAWENRFNVHFVFAGNRQTGERTAKRLLMHAYKEITKLSSGSDKDVVA